MKLRSLLITLIALSIFSSVNLLNQQHSLAAIGTLQFGTSGERVSFPQAIGTNGELLTIVDIQAVAGNTIILYKSPTSDSYFYHVIAERKLSLKNWPFVSETITLKSNGEDTELLKVQINNEGLVIGVSYLDDNFWYTAETVEITSELVATAQPQRPLPPFTKVPAGGPPVNPCRSGWVYSGSYWTSGGCLIDVYKCGSSSVFSMVACCDDPESSFPSGPDCQDFGV